jgi:hypothetical protein
MTTQLPGLVSATLRPLYTVTPAHSTGAASSRYCLGGGRRSRHRRARTARSCRRRSSPCSSAARTESPSRPSTLKSNREPWADYQRLQTFLHAQPAPWRQTRRCVQAIRARSTRVASATAAWMLAGAVDIVALAFGVSVAVAVRSAAVPAARSGSLGMRSSLGSYWAGD